MVRAEMVRLARDLWPTWLRGPPDRPRRTDEARRRGACSTRSPRSTRRRTSCSTGAGPRSPDRGVLPRARASSAWPTSRSRSAGRRSSCAPTAARSSTRPARSTRARSRSSGSRRPRGLVAGAGRRVVPARGQRPDAPAARASTRACPATTSSWRRRNRDPIADRATIFGSGMFAEGWAVYVTQVMMDLGYGDDDPALMLDPLEVLPARDHQRDHRRPDPPRRGHDRGRGDGR